MDSAQLRSRCSGKVPHTAAPADSRITISHVKILSSVVKKEEPEDKDHFLFPSEMQASRPSPVIYRNAGLTMPTKHSQVERLPDGGRSKGSAEARTVPLNMEIPNRSENWTKEESLALIQLWGDPDTQQDLEKSGRTEPIYHRITERFNKKMCCERTTKQVRNKLKDLRRNYKICKDNNSRNGRSRGTFAFFEEMDRVLGSRPTTRPSALMDTAALEDHDDSDIINKDSQSVTTATNSLRPSPSISPTPSTPDSTTSTETTSSANTSVSPAATTNKGSTSRKRKSVGLFQKQEKVLKNVVSLFLAYQEKSEKRFEEMEEKRMRFESEQEDRRREAERQHEERMLRIMMTMFKPWKQQPQEHHQYQPHYHPPPTQL